LIGGTGEDQFISRWVHRFLLIGIGLKTLDNAWQRHIHANLSLSLHYSEKAGREGYAQTIPLEPT
jgi:hypothetical protein